jgi:hypothetical protein
VVLDVGEPGGEPLKNAIEDRHDYTLRNTRRSNTIRDGGVAKHQWESLSDNRD